MKPIRILDDGDALIKQISHKNLGIAVRFEINENAYCVFITNMEYKCTFSLETVCQLATESGEMAINWFFESETGEREKNIHPKKIVLQIKEFFKGV